MAIRSIKHKKSKRAHIPSKEEAGTEDASPKVKKGKKSADYPLNPVVHRGQDPELFWMHKYGEDDTVDCLSVDIRSLYRHEHIAPETLIQNFYRLKEATGDQASFINDLFGNALELDEIDKISEYYKHSDGWTNRLIQGDSLLVMSSLLEREGMAGQVQCIYIDPPYGIKYGSNWQMKLNNRTVTDGKDADLTGEPEQIRAYRDTWELGIHSYLSYLRERLVVAKDLLTESGSCFVQISDENVHLVRCLMDEVFGSENFVSQIFFQTTSGFETNTLATLGDFILWYARDKTTVKVRKLFEKEEPVLGEGNARWVLLPDGEYRGVTAAEKRGEEALPEGAKLYSPGDLQSQGPASKPQPFEHEGKTYRPNDNNHWKANYPKGMQRLADAGRIHVAKNSIRYRRFFDDFPYKERGNIWTDTLTGSFTAEKLFVVYTSAKVIGRCVLLTTDPGDLVLDPTCGSGTTAFVAEQWGRRWVTVDTSRIALNIAKTRLMTSTFPYYKLHDEDGGDVRQGFNYETVPHIKLESIANDEPVKNETLYDDPNDDPKKLRVSGPFTVETLQNFEPVPPSELDEAVPDAGEIESFEERVFEHLKSAGVKNGIRNEQAVFTRIDRLGHAYLHAEGFYNTAKGERKAYLHIGPKFGTVSKQAVNEAMKECRARGDADWLIILGFSFESAISNENVTTSVGSFEVTPVRMHDDLMQDGLLKRDKKAASFVTIGEPDIAVKPVKGKKSEAGNKMVQVQIKGLDIYDPIKDEVKARDVHDIAYWMVDDNYDGSNFVVKQIFFCGGKKDEFDKWKKGLENMAKTSAKRQAEKTLRIEIDDDAFDRVYNHTSHPIEVTEDGKKIAARVISQFGEESTRVIEVSTQSS
ncbi:site-specific DNA-methyltransferase [Verrucomicrobiota bacterium]